MPATLKGKIAVFSVTGALSFTGAAKTTNRLVGSNLTDEFEVSELTDGNDDVIGAAAHRHRHRCTFDVIPYDASGNIATAKTNVKLPDPLALVTIEDFGIDELDGTWNYAGGGTIALTPEGWIRMTLPCARYGATPAALS